MIKLFSQACNIILGLYNQILLVNFLTMLHKNQKKFSLQQVVDKTKPNALKFITSNQKGATVMKNKQIQKFLEEIVNDKDFKELFYSFQKKAKTLDLQKSDYQKFVNEVFLPKAKALNYTFTESDFIEFFKSQTFENLDKLSQADLENISGGGLLAAIFGMFALISSCMGGSSAPSQQLAITNPTPHTPAYRQYNSAVYPTVNTSPQDVPTANADYNGNLTSATQLYSPSNLDVSKEDINWLSVAENNDSIATSSSEKLSSVASNAWQYALIKQPSYSNSGVLSILEKIKDWQNLHKEQPSEISTTKLHELSEKVILFGSPSTGKSTFVNRVLGTDFPTGEAYGVTTGVTCVEGDIQGTWVQMCDTPGLHDKASEAELAGIRNAVEDLPTATTLFTLFNARIPLMEQSTDEIIEHVIHAKEKNPNLKIIGVVARANQAPDLASKSLEILQKNPIFDEVFALGNSEESYDNAKNKITSCLFNPDTAYSLE